MIRKRLRSFIVTIAPRKNCIIFAMRNRLMWVGTILGAVTISSIGLVGSQATTQTPATPAGWILGEDADEKESAPGGCRDARHR